jgi:YD repeat-containing protein
MTYYTVDDEAGNFRVGDLATVTNAAGHTTSYLAYDGNGRPKVVSDPNGLVTQYDYWPRGWLKSRSTGTAGDLLVT